MTVATQLFGPRVRTQSSTARGLVKKNNSTRHCHTRDNMYNENLDNTSVFFVFLGLGFVANLKLPVSVMLLRNSKTATTRGAAYCCHAKACKKPKPLLFAARFTTTRVIVTK